MWSETIKSGAYTGHALATLHTQAHTDYNGLTEYTLRTQAHTETRHMGRPNTAISTTMLFGKRVYLYAECDNIFKKTYTYLYKYVCIF